MGRNARVPQYYGGREYQALKPAVDAAIARVLDSGVFVESEEVAAFEREFSAFCGVPHGVATASGSTALLVGLHALGIGRDDEVITAAYTCSSTTSAISHAGAKIRFADLDEETLTLDPEQVRRQINLATRAILPVHLHGQVADMQSICALADEHNLMVLEDAALAAGAEQNGRRVGGLGHAGAISFAPSKILGGMGWGGILLTHDARVAHRARRIAAYGSRADEGDDPEALEGFGALMSGIEAAILRAKMPQLEVWIAQRRAVCARYDEACDRLGIRRLHPPANTTVTSRVYIIRHPDRDRVIGELQSRGVDAGKHFTPPMHLRPLYAHLGYRPGDLPVTERVASEVICLPTHPHLSDADVERVCAALEKVA
jgi:dTDP-4-amino-4,6-dideoxygalactose transaminase